MSHPRYRKKFQAPRLGGIQSRRYALNKVAQPIDIWLQRLSHISQLGLFVFTLGTIYFTVIPLYQKAVLDEAIAQKEIELKEANAALKRAYERIRQSAISGYIRAASAECTGLLIPPEKKFSGNRSKIDPILEIDVSTCLIGLTQKTYLSDLTQQDADEFKKQISHLAIDLDLLRKAAISEFNSVPSKDPATLPPLDSSSPTYRMFEYLRPKMNSEQYLAGERKAILRQEQSRIAFDYAKEARDRIFALRTLRWNEK